MIKIRKIKVEPTDVYDITVPETECFFANDILVHNCAEIALSTRPILNRIDTKTGKVEFEGWVQLCTLAAINLGTLRNLSDLERRMDLLVRALNEILDYQEYPIPQAEIATQLFRPLGIGVINYAYWLAKNGFTYNDPEGHDATHELAEAMYYYALKASVNLARNRGKPLPGLEHTIYSDGRLLIDNYCTEVDKLVTVGLKLDWETLRADVKKYGVYNSTLLALMPSESCLKWDHKIQTSQGELNFHQICEMNGIDWENIESFDRIGWYELENKIKVPTLDGEKEVSRIYFNGNKEVLTINMEDGQEIKCTATHKFLVQDQKGERFWKYAIDLEEGDDIVEYLR